MHAAAKLPGASPALRQLGRALTVAALLAAPLPAFPQAAHGSEAAHRTSTAAPEPTLPPDLQEIREAMRKYADPVVAVRDGFASHAPVGTFRPNQYGLHDVLGNVAELTVGQIEGRAGTSFLARGGSYMLRPIDSRIGSVRLVLPNQTTPEIGVRVARSLPRN